jgi:hypothetical protein
MPDRAGGSKPFDLKKYIQREFGIRKSEIPYLLVDPPQPPLKKGEN